MSHYENFFSIAEATDEEAFKRGLIRVTQALGFPLVNATAIQLDAQDKSLRSIKSFRVIPNGWQDKVSVPQDVARDPVVRLLRTTYQPFTYDQSTYVKANAGDLWEEQKQFGYHTGVASILHGLNGRHFWIGLDREEPLPKDQHKLMQLMADVQLLTTFVQETAFRLLIPNGAVSFDREKLTERQIEVLKWASAGKSAWETGTILSISESTVTKHLDAARSRLGCSSKSQAIARAFSQGLL